MKYRRLGRSELDVSVICLGTMTFGTPVAEADAVRLTHQAIDQGVNFIDTANMYEGYKRVLGSPGGVAEEILGKALRGRRDRVVLVTKVGNPVGAGPDDKGLGRVHVRRELDKSLRRMGTDYVDVFYMHRPDSETPLAETLAVFNEILADGKARHYGFSNYNADQTREILRLCAREGLRRPLVTQPPYSLLTRGIENDFLPLCIREGIAVTPYQVLQGSLLTGKYRRGMPAPEGSRKDEKANWVWELSDELFDRLDKIEADARAAGRTMTEHAISWALEQPGITAVVLGVRNADQLLEAIRATGKLT